MATIRPEGGDEAVRAALARGQLSVTAACPRDGQATTVWRVVRGERGAIVELTMHCPRCGQAFTAPLESLTLR